MLVSSGFAFCQLTVSSERPANLCLMTSRAKPSRVSEFPRKRTFPEVESRNDRAIDGILDKCSRSSDSRFLLKCTATSSSSSTATIARHVLSSFLELEVDELMRYRWRKTN